MKLGERAAYSEASTGSNIALKEKKNTSNFLIYSYWHIFIRHFYPKQLIF